MCLQKRLKSVICHYQKLMFVIEEMKTTSNTILYDYNIVLLACGHVPTQNQVSAELI